MELDQDLLKKFEHGLDPAAPEKSSVPARLIGYGEISGIFRIRDLPLAFKRLPIFDDRPEAEAYESMFWEYCGLLSRAGLLSPECRTAVIEAPGGGVVLYIAQEMFPAERFVNRLLLVEDRVDREEMVRRVLAEAEKVWAFSRENGPELEIAVDGQLSNWVWPQGRDRPVYVDTGTPFIRRNGRHDLDPRLILKAAPSFLRRLLELLFVQEVMNRYYDPRKNMIDLTANVFKEGRPELVAEVLREVNAALPGAIEQVTLKEVQAYYREDKFIWTLFLSLRRFDRFLQTWVFRKRYPFILPGRINR